MMERVKVSRKVIVRKEVERMRIRPKRAFMTHVIESDPRYDISVIQTDHEEYKVMVQGTLYYARVDLTHARNLYRYARAMIITGRKLQRTDDGGCYWR